MTISNLFRYFYNLFLESGLSQEIATTLNLVINLIIVLILAYVLFKLLRYAAETFVASFAEKSKTKFDDFLVENKTFLHLSNLLTINFVSLLIPDLFYDYPDFEILAEKFVGVLTVVFVIWLLRSILLTLKDFLRTINAFKDKPVESYIQVVMIILWLFALILIFGIVTGQSVIKLLTGLGALSAILLLVFKDTILGFVASIQVTVNDTVRIGDWITMEKYSADGDVFEINLASVKVRNFDNTITTIPTYYLISDSFKNWRGMAQSGGRRMKRSVLIKSQSVKFITDQDLDKYKGVHLIADYVQQRSQEINEHNKENEIDKSILVNGRNMTNFGLFRRYIDAYLRSHPGVNQDMMIMCRHLAPTPNGIPLEIYAFSADKAWVNYEGIMADIFDHVFASVPYFDLEIFEYPTGTDFAKLTDNIN